MQTSPHPSAERFRITPQPLHYGVWQTRGSFPGAACCRTIELPSYEAAPQRPRDLSPFTFHPLTSLSRATIHPLPANRCHQATPGNGATILPGRYRHREKRSAIVLPNLHLCPENSQ
jgi:hypothetical protein